jgi:hypothetical protein
LSSLSFLCHACLRRERLALSIGSNWMGSTWRRRQNPVSEALCLKGRTVANIQNCDSYINIPSSQTYR